jgi:hypothetical protein
MYAHKGHKYECLFSYEWYLWFRNKARKPCHSTDHLFSDRANLSGFYNLVIEYFTVETAPINNIRLNIIYRLLFIDLQLKKFSVADAEVNYANK